MKAISEIYEQNGSKVIGMSLFAVASENLEKDAEIEIKTIASWSHEQIVYNEAKEKILSFDSVVADGILKQFDWYIDLKRTEGSAAVLCYKKADCHEINEGKRKMEKSEKILSI